MSNSVISFMFAAGLSGWIYSKLMRQTGGNSKSAIIAAGICGLLAFGVFLMLLNAITPN